MNKLEIDSMQQAEENNIRDGQSRHIASNRFPFHLFRAHNIPEITWEVRVRRKYLTSRRHFIATLFLSFEKSTDGAR